MEISIILTEQILKLFLILLLGFLLVKTGKLKASDSKCISVILVYLILPCVIINSFQIDYTPQVRDGLLFTLAASVAAHIIFIAFTKIAQKSLNLDVIEQLTVIYTNGGILVVPLIKALLGDKYVVYSCSFIVVQLILIWTHCCHMLNQNEGFQWKKILLNINVISIIIGALLSFTRIHLPEVLGGTIDMMSNMIGPMGMLLAGMAISETPLKDVFARARNYVAVILRLLICPLIILVLIKITGVTSILSDGKNILLTVYLACITPACATVTSLAQLYDKDAAYSSTLYVLTTVCSILTMPLMILLYSLWI
ncbi:MAG: AEC family transporter [Clostridia bacterium]|nr:AEC family transporter [Clostridia bacterium]